MVGGIEERHFCFAILWQRPAVVFDNLKNRSVIFAVAAAMATAM